MAEAPAVLEPQPACSQGAGCRLLLTYQLRMHACAQIDFQTYRNCPVADELGFLETCAIDINSPKFPIPVQPAQDFPALMHVIQVLFELTSSAVLCSSTLHTAVGCDVSECTDWHACVAMLTPPLAAPDVWCC